MFPPLLCFAKGRRKGDVPPTGYQWCDPRFYIQHPGHGNDHGLRHNPGHPFFPRRGLHDRLLRGGGGGSSFHGVGILWLEYPSDPRRDVSSRDDGRRSPGDPGGQNLLSAHSPQPPYQLPRLRHRILHFYSASRHSYLGL